MYQRILYTSQASPGVGLREAYDIIRTSHNRNSTAGLTGGLLFLDGYFIQVLEGGPYAIEQRYKSIAADKRHFDVQLRSDQMVDAPMFPGEWMALRSRDQVSSELLGSERYEIGMPVDRFDGDQLLSLVTDCFDEVPC